MTEVDLINYLSIVVLIGFVIALGYLIVLLHRANRILAKIDNLQQTFASFVSEIVPAIVNIGTISTALHGVLRMFHIERDEKKSKKSGK